MYNVRGIFPFRKSVANYEQTAILQGWPTSHILLCLQYIRNGYDPLDDISYILHGAEFFLRS